MGQRRGVRQHHPRQRLQGDRRAAPMAALERPLLPHAEGRAPRRAAAARGHAPPRAGRCDQPGDASDGDGAGAVGRPRGAVAVALRLERIAGAAQIVRVYEAAQPAPMAPYIASFVLEWPLDGDQRSVWIKAMQGRMPPSALRELALLLIEKGVRFVLAKRAEGHVLPL